MPPFREDSIVIIALGSHTTLAQLGLPESFTPARLHIPSRMYPTEDGLWSHQEPEPPAETDAEKENPDDAAVSKRSSWIPPEPVWPIVKGQIVNWECFYGLLSHVLAEINPGFYSPYMIISDPCWTTRDCERITQFIFEKFKPPALAMMDSAVATCYGFGLQTATVVDVAYQKLNVSAISEHILQERTRVVGLTNCAGDAMTDRLFELLEPKGFTRDMCEQLKCSPITEILLPGVPLPGSTSDSSNNPMEIASPAAILSSASGAAPGATDDLKVDEEGVLDVTSILASNNMNDILTRKEREKAEKAGKKGGDAAQTTKQAKLRNCEKQTNTFVYEKPGKTPAQPGSDPAVEVVLDRPEGGEEEGTGDGAAEDAMAVDEVPESNTVEMEVGLERFQAASGGILDRVADAVFKTIQGVDEMSKRSDLWDSIVIVGNGSKIKGFKEALMATLRNRFLTTPFTGMASFSIDNSRGSTPSTAATGTSTPVNPAGPGGAGGPSQPSSVNPLLVAATTGNIAGLHQPGGAGGAASGAGPGLPHFIIHSQTPTSIKMAKLPEYFPEWKEFGYEEGVFLGGQVAARVLFISDQANNNKGYMTRTDYNEMGPPGITEFRI